MICRLREEVDAALNALPIDPAFCVSEPYYPILDDGRGPDRSRVMICVDCRVSPETKKLSGFITSIAMIDRREWMRCRKRGEVLRRVIQEACDCCRELAAKSHQCIIAMIDEDFGHE